MKDDILIQDDDENIFYFSHKLPFLFCGLATLILFYFYFAKGCHYFKILISSRFEVFDFILLN
jgi:hypothetical protein